MPRPVPIAPFLSAGIAMIDVRSPGEHARGHIPGSVNLPLFTDSERAVIGTLYKQQGRDAAMLEGLRIIGPKMAAIVEQARAINPTGPVGVYCWRGGERSASAAWLLEKAGFTEVLTLKSGYKAFRNHVLASFDHPWKLNVLGGYTGTGKSELLGFLRERGEQVLDLEGLAHHKGSSYGGIGEKDQPSTEHFENLIWHVLSAFDQQRPVWVEDESQMVGHAKIPDPLYRRMRNSTVHFIDMPVEQRAARLVKDYGAFPRPELAEATTRIRKRLGPQHAKEALHALEVGDLRQAALITLKYYDKAYARGLAARDPELTRHIPSGGLSPAELALKLLHHERNNA